MIENSPPSIIPYIMTVALCVAVFQLFLLWKNNRHHYNWQKRVQALSYSLTKSEKLREARIRLEEVFDTRNVKGPIQVNKIDEASNYHKDIIHCIRDILGHWENLALAIKLNIADEEVAYEMVASTVIHHVVIFQEHIKQRQEVNPRAYEYLIGLTYSWLEKLPENERPQYYHLNLQKNLIG
ncbi:hypothetical protein CKO35_15680 [Ectothiorhodospira shaposhnikovii]|uniref:DUF4760 domain-containing protein n=1 Tax=Ectothiorhodospira shaposhnikovii TaxID=1054 RepID=UPI001905EB5F|nr:DUF4760 domain-containing protein [Ectothiorhodospira shaposhnikovii]MBK1674704.1 hypothetical protein [Ectothiorhodospira shaposhnikovii]